MNDLLGRYIYCIIETDEDKTFGETVGEPGGLLRTVRDRDLAAVVSNALIKEYPVTREASLAHQRAIEQVMKAGYTVLPVKFSTVAEDESEIISQVLQARYEELKGLLEEMQGKHEIALKGSWTHMDRVFQSIVRQHPEIRRLRDELAEKDPAARYYEQIELGKLVEEALEEKKQAEAKRILEGLSKYVYDTKENQPYGNEALLNAAFLVEETRQEAFSRAVSRLQTRFKKTTRFKMIVGAPPFNFVNVIIHWERDSKPEEAQDRVSSG